MIVHTGNYPAAVALRVSHWYGLRKHRVRTARPTARGQPEAVGTAPAGDRYASPTRETLGTVCGGDVRSLWHLPGFSVESFAAWTSRTARTRAHFGPGHALIVRQLRALLQS